MEKIVDRRECVRVDGEQGFVHECQRKFRFNRLPKLVGGANLDFGCRSRFINRERLKVVVGAGLVSLPTHLQVQSPFDNEVLLCRAELLTIYRRHPKIEVWKVCVSDRELKRVHARFQCEHFITDDPFAFKRD